MKGYAKRFQQIIIYQNKSTQNFRLTPNSLIYKAIESLIKINRD